MKVTSKSSHNKRHFNYFCIAFLLNTVMPAGIIYSANPTPLRPVKRGVTWSMGPAAGFGGPSLTWSAMAVHAAVMPLVQPAIQNVLDVLYYQVDGHCRKKSRERWLVMWNTSI